MSARVLSPQEPNIKRQVKLPTNHTFSIKKNDITEEHVEVIVNAANGFLKHGGGKCHLKKTFLKPKDFTVEMKLGVAGAIVAKGGQIIQQQSNEIIKKLGGSYHSELFEIQLLLTSCISLYRRTRRRPGSINNSGKSSFKLRISRCRSDLQQQSAG